MGGNGVGKSALLDVITRIKRVVIEGQSLDTQFPRETLPRWSKELVQECELEFLASGTLFAYQLRVLHKPHYGSPNILSESVTLDGMEIYSFDGGKAVVTDATGSKRAMSHLSTGSSTLRHLAGPSDRPELTVLLTRLNRIRCVRAVPSAMSGEEMPGASPLDVEALNFARWYLDQVVKRSEEAIRLRDDLRNAIAGFDSISVDSENSGHRYLEVRLRPQSRAEQFAGTVQRFDFSELSDGQRVLILLYSLVHFAVGSESTVCFDEPDNYVSLREIQPWLMLLMETVQAGKGQAIIVSHHPELLNQLVPDHATVFRRAVDGGVIAEPYKPSANGALTPAEEVARGWNNV